MAGKALAPTRAGLAGGGEDEDRKKEAEEEAEEEEERRQGLGSKGRVNGGERASATRPHHGKLPVGDCLAGGVSFIDKRDQCLPYPPQRRKAVFAHQTNNAE